MVNVLKKFKDLFLSDGPAPQEGERREFHRYGFGHLGKTNLFIGPLAFPVEDMSYGGLSIRAPLEEIQDFMDQDGVFEARLQCFHIERVFVLTVANNRDGLIGCSTVHGDIEGLMWLRDILEFVRVGMDITPFPERNSPAGSRTVKCFRGSFGTNLSVTSDAKNPMYRFDLSFRDSGVPSKVEYIEGEVTFRRFDDVDDDSFKALEQSLFILAGFIRTNQVPEIKEVFKAIEDKIDSLLERKSSKLTG